MDKTLARVSSNSNLNPFGNVNSSHLDMTAKNAFDAINAQKLGRWQHRQSVLNALGSVGDYASIIQGIGDVTSSLMQVGNNEEGMSEAQIDSRNKQIAGGTTASIIGIVLSVLSICAAA